MSISAARSNAAKSGLTEPTQITGLVAKRVVITSAADLAQPLRLQAAAGCRLRLRATTTEESEVSKCKKQDTNDWDCKWTHLIFLKIHDTII